MDDLRATPLWQAFARKAKDKQKVLVENLAEKAANRLDRVIETFPNYTLHNRVHALNVVKCMGDLLGPYVDELSSLEGAFFILSAYLHDIGMVFTDEERQAIASEEAFSAFLKANPQAEVGLEQWRAGHPSELNGVPAGVAEWYCRWSHAGRVHLYLANLEHAEVLWDGQGIREMLGKVCESHNFDLERLWNSGLRPDYQGEADLLFSAILLRLADILDFDNSRSPEEVYRYLRLDQPQDDTERKSETEWRKHLASGGFVFPPSRGQRYALAFKATPDHPAVEHDIRQFLNVIENEMRQCNSLLVHCADKWRKALLPFSISRENITSNGYKYGEHRFTLEQTQILDLLMGENIYEDPYVFVRELIQNAIDTTRHREFYEHTKSPSYKPRPIQLTSWQDRDGYQWMRIDDYGMGMDESLIVKYLLKVGASYYQSSEFKAELLRYVSAGESFVPISRFGIGLLSCFIAGDQLEISTYRLTSPDQSMGPLRLSMHGLRSFFTMHLKSNPYHKPTNMPSRLEKEEKYRTEPGTSIAVRLDPMRDQSGFDLRKIVEKWVLHPPVPIEVQGEPIGENLAEIGPLQKAVEVPFASDQTVEVERVLGVKLSAPLRLRIVPLNLTQYSGTPDMAGQAVLAYVAGLPHPLGEDLGEDRQAREVEVKFEKGDFEVSCSYRNLSKMERLGVPRYSFSLEERSLELMRRIENLEEDLHRAGVSRLRSYRSYSRLSDDDDPDREIRLAIAAAATITELLEAGKNCRHQAYRGSPPDGFVERQALAFVNELWDRTHNETLALLFQSFMRSGSQELWEELQGETAKVKDLDDSTSERTQLVRRLRLSLRDAIREYREFVREAPEAYRDVRLKFEFENIPLPSQLTNFGSERWLSHKRWLSHNGICVPTGRGHGAGSFGVGSPVKGGWFAIQLALRDTLRPDLSLSRDDLRGLSWQTYSRLALALSRALRANVSDVAYNVRVFDDSLKKKSTELEEILRAGEIRQAWEDEPVIGEYYDTPQSLRNIRERVARGEEVRLAQPVGIHEWFHGTPNFIKCCVSALLQIGVSLSLKVSGYSTKLVVSGAEPSPLQDGQLAFPPLFFVPYEDSPLLRYADYPINLNHPFSQWLVTNARRIRRQHPGLFESLRTNVSREYSYAAEFQKELAGTLSSVLERLHHIDPELVPEHLKLKPEDFER